VAEPAPDDGGGGLGSVATAGAAVTLLDGWEVTFPASLRLR
jgi:hypothetical protein